MLQLLQYILFIQDTSVFISEASAYFDVPTTSSDCQPILILNVETSFPWMSENNNA